MAKEGIEIEDIFETLEKSKTKKKNGCRKGKNVERILCKVLDKQFNDTFARVIGSGNRWSQTNLPDNAKQVYSGDICVPEGFKWVIECKGGYEDDVNFTNLLDKDTGIPRVNEWIEQTTKDSEYCGRKPIVFWKRNRKPWLTMIRTKDLNGMKFKQRIHYRDWTWLNLEVLFEKTKREFWYDEE